jgi:hypothetical protein
MRLPVVLAVDGIRHAPLSSHAHATSAPQFQRWCMQKGLGISAPYHVTDRFGSQRRTNFLLDGKAAGRIIACDQIAASAQYDILPCRQSTPNRPLCLGNRARRRLQQIGDIDCYRNRCRVSLVHGITD